MVCGEAGGSAQQSDPPPAKTDSLLGEGLETALINACRPHLSDIRWFRTDWQRGGALTGYATYQTDAGPRDAVVKMPLPPRELLWLQRLQPTNHEAGPVVPELFASGHAVNGYDLAWVVMERLPHGPLGSPWAGTEFDLLLEAAGRFYAAAESVPVDKPPRAEDWPAILQRARKRLRDHGVDDEQRWNKAIKALQKKLDHVLAAWDARDVNHWCHGDLHLANAMTRDEPPAGPALLFDFAEVHAGHWVEDAVYFEHLFWGREERLNGCKPAKHLAQQRKGHALKLDPDWPTHANIRRVLLAASVPAYLHHEGDRRHLAGALDVLERSLKQIKV